MFSHPRGLQAFHILTFWGVLRWLNNFLNRRALNNGVSDQYDCSKDGVVATGGSDGIGKAVVNLLTVSEAKVAILDVQPPTYEVSPKYYRCDITSSFVIVKFASEIRVDMGELTALMNIAGVGHGKTILNAIEAEHRWVFDVNALSHYLLAKEFIPSIVSRNHGMVVTLASAAGYAVVADNVDYSASKATAITFHEGLTTELMTRYNAPRARTFLVTPGAVRTPLIIGWNQPQRLLDYMPEPETLAEEIVKKVLAGQGGQLTLPGYYGFLCLLIRARPYWMSNSLRNQNEKAAVTSGGGWSKTQIKKYAKA